MPSKFEKLLDYIVNEDTAKARELFHEIVVEKSRTIYENLMSEELGEEDDMIEGDMEPVEESDEEMMEFKSDDDDDYAMGGDPADKFVDDVVDDDAMGGGSESDFGDEMGGEDGSAPATKDDIMDIADALEDLKKEFEALLSNGDSNFGDDEGDEGLEVGADDEDEDEEFSPEDEEFSPEDEMEMIREYRELVAKVNNTEDGVNAKSPINTKFDGRPSGGKVSAGNIAQGGKPATPTKPKVGSDYADGIQNVNRKETKGYSSKVPVANRTEQNANTKIVLPK